MNCQEFPQDDVTSLTVQSLQNKGVIASVHQPAKAPIGVNRHLTQDQVRSDLEHQCVFIRLSEDIGVVVSNNHLSAN